MSGLMIANLSAGAAARRIRRSRRGICQVVIPGLYRHGAGYIAGIAGSRIGVLTTLASLAVRVCAWGRVHHGR